eukprot:gene3456-8160_t
MPAPADAEPRAPSVPAGAAVLMETLLLASPWGFDVDDDCPDAELDGVDDAVDALAGDDAEPAAVPLPDDGSLFAGEEEEAAEPAAEIAAEPAAEPAAADDDYGDLWGGGGSDDKPPPRRGGARDAQMIDDDSDAAAAPATPAGAAAKPAASTDSVYRNKALRTRRVKKAAAAAVGDKPQAPKEKKADTDKTVERVTKMLGGKEQFDALKKRFKDCAGNRVKEDGIIIAVLTQHAFGEREMHAICGLGPQRWKRIKGENPGLVKKDGQFSAEELQRAKDAINGWETECGFACKHRAQREYLLKGSFENNHAEYKAEQVDAGHRALGYSRFYVLITSERPMLRSTRLRQDLCDVCARIKNMLEVIEGQIAHDTRLTDPQKEQLRQRVEEMKEEQKAHDKASETQRRAMNDHVKEHCAKWTDEPPPVAWPPVLHEMPDVGGKGENEVQNNDLDEKGKKLRSRRVLVCCQDYGQSVTIPTYKTARPSIDHWTSNLLGHIFIHADLTRNRNFVYGYDERVAGKGADALATLRWLHWSSEIAELLKMEVALPDEIIVICDNC